jgi:hypothetical protein
VCGDCSERGNAFQIFPEGLPLQFFVPYVRTLEEWNKQTLGLHKNCLGSADLSIHRYYLDALPSVPFDVISAVRNFTATGSKTLSP